jgi:hypothetical protein
MCPHLHHSELNNSQWEGDAALIEAEEAQQGVLVVQEGVEKQQQQQQQQQQHVDSDPRFPAACFWETPDAHSSLDNSAERDGIQMQPTGDHSDQDRCVLATDHSIRHGSAIEAEGASVDTTQPVRQQQQQQQRVMEVRASRAVVTLPLGLLKCGAVQFEPPLEVVAPHKMHAVEALGAAVYDKVRRRTWGVKR